MIRKSKSVEKRGKKRPSKKAKAAAKHADKYKCNHCGGMLKIRPGDEACINCGREADHICPNCLFGEQSVAA